jgi:hypothetical protein
MRLREKLIGAVVALASSVLLVSCAPEEQSCDPVAGVYQPIYVWRGGTCEFELPKTSVPLDGGASGFKMNTVMEFGRNIVTTVVHKGCTIRVTQEIVAKNGMVESTMNGGDIAVLSSKQLTGEVNYARFSPTMPQVEVCRGTYEATFTRPDSVAAPAY